MDGGLAIDHVYRFEWLPSVVRWFVDGKLIREETTHVPTKPQQLHINLWGAPQTDPPNGGPWGKNPGDPTGPNITDPSLLIAPNAAQNKSYYFDVDYVKVERLATLVGDGTHNNMLGTAAAEALDGGAGDDVIDAGGGNDVVAGGAGNDTLRGEAGDDALYGGTGSNIMSGGAGADRFHTLDGADTIRDTLADLHGDTMAGFGANDAIQIMGALVGRGDVAVAPGTGGSSVTIGGTTFQVEGNHSGGDFMTVARGTGADANTLLTFQNFLPTLQEGARVDSAKINGIANEAVPDRRRRGRLLGGTEVGRVDLRQHARLLQDRRRRHDRRRQHPVQQHDERGVGRPHRRSRHARGRRARRLLPDPERLQQVRRAAGQPVVRDAGYGNAVRRRRR